MKDRVTVRIDCEHLYFNKLFEPICRLTNKDCQYKIYYKDGKSKICKNFKEED